jgi:hypothetical protein
MRTSLSVRKTRRIASQARTLRKQIKLRKITNRCLMTDAGLPWDAFLNESIKEKSCNTAGEHN